MQTGFWTLMLILVGLFIFFGFKDDVQQNPKNFFRIVISLPLSMFTAVLGLKCYNNKIRNWALSTPPEEKIKKD
ncbi:MAG: hypothetical protein MRZ79_17970 [Bacteroidia bacterium]|nr:hypothetical protein [Bacteroidia bacterium]